MSVRRSRRLLFVLVGMILLDLPAFAQDSPAAEPPEPTGGLATKQESIAIRYERFENTLLQMAEYMRKTDPARADLLIRAIGRSKETRLPDQMQQLVQLLQKEQLGDAVERQEEVVKHLMGLLELLQSEDRQKEIDEEEKRIEALLKDLRKLIAREQDTRAGTERGEPFGRLTERQQQIADSAKELGQRIDAQDAERNSQSSGRSEGQNRSEDQKPGDSSQKSGEPKEGSPKDPSGKDKPESADKPDDSPKEGDPKEGESSEKRPGDSSKSDEQQSGKSGKPSEGSESEGQQKSGQQSQGQQSQGQQSQQQSQQSPQPGEQSQQRTPGREELEQARQEMERAIEELKKEAREAASGHQDEAVAKLREAEAKLEEILRQLREEEREMMLAALEARFREMLAQQLIVYNGTVNLHAIPEKERTGRHRSKASELARQEEAISLLAAKALTLLQEDGSSVAFPEAVEQLHDDMLTVARRLDQADVGELTQSIERDIIEALEEMIEALQKEMEKKDQKQQQQQPMNGEPPDPSLVDTLAELKMLRSLQYRVNRRTTQLGRLVDGEQASEPDLIRQLQQLSRRQASIQQATYDLATGRNR